MGTRGTALTNLRRTSLREQALDALRSAITAGKIAPGTRLIETELSGQLGISRGTLREALRELHQQGLVTLDSSRGMSVRSLDREEIEDIFSVRAALEALAVETLSTREDRAAIARELRAKLAGMETARGNGSLEDEVEADLDFHHDLCRLSENSTLIHTWESLEGSIRMTIAWSGLGKAVGNMSPQRHAAVVDGIESGDPGQAASALRQHMREAIANLLGEA
ncbi:GntR family transcriptional regulator [Rothia halotolerans]|uniref:GntR family transcriptional regulator n=1 Tax=Rothia halotolerans TaxID=405770 RepID=UPI00101DC352|nr:GntR family transcriptional regulator [Rothia halotolerans]